MGVTLLRVVDPEFKTKTLEDYGLAYVFISFFEIAIITIVPSLVANGVILMPALILTGSAVACIVLTRMLNGWHADIPANALREGEADVIKEFNMEEKVA